MALLQGKLSRDQKNMENDHILPTDQLAREWDNLTRLASREEREPVLLYLTADIGCPTLDIQRSQRELEKKREMRGRICWLSWRHLVSLISTSSYDVLRDLAMVLRRLNLTFFEGFSLIELTKPIQWSFRA